MTFCFHRTWVIKCSFNIYFHPPTEKLDQALTQYEIEERHTEGYTTGVAMAKGIDPNNKTASISRRTKRLTSVPLDEIFERTDDAKEDQYQNTPGGARKPVVPVPGYSPGELNTSGGSSNMGRANSTPNLAPGLTVMTTSEGEYSRNITRVDVGREGNVSHSYAINHNDIPSNVANVRLSTVPTNDQVSYNDGIYAVPFKGPKRSDSADRLDNHGYAQTGRHIPPRPQEARPQAGNQGMPPPPSPPFLQHLPQTAATESWSRSKRSTSMDTQTCPRTLCAVKR